jgi:hypothetical protein
VHTSSFLVLIVDQAMTEKVNSYVRSWPSRSYLTSAVLDDVVSLIAEVLRQTDASLSQTFGLTSDRAGDLCILFPSQTHCCASSLTNHITQTLVDHGDQDICKWAINGLKSALRLGSRSISEMSDGVARHSQVLSRSCPTIYHHRARCKYMKLSVYRQTSSISFRLASCYVLTECLRLSNRFNPH